MPGTWKEVSLSLGINGSPHDEIAIEAGAYYMARLRHVWAVERTSLQRNALAQASYNAGAGNIIKAQKLCGNARLWETVAVCLHMVTGQKNAAETRTYVARIAAWWREMELVP